MQSFISIDWFTGVSRYAKQHPFPSREGDFTFVQDRGWSGYDVGSRELDTNLKRYSSSTREDMGKAILASGSSLRALSEHGYAGDLLKALFSEGFREYRCSRIDFAVDVLDYGELAQKVARSARRQVIKTHARQVSLIEGVTGVSGITTYIGSRESTRFGRVYDKNAQSSGKMPVSRFELQCNKEFAHDMWMSIKRPEQSELNFAALAAWNGFVTDWGDESINSEVMFIQSALPAPKPPAADDRWTWIESQVLPSLQRDWYLADDKSTTLLARIVKAVTGS